MPAIQALLNISEASVDVIENRGKRYRVVGYVDGACPVDVCNAVCCRVASLKGKVGDGPCNFLGDDNLCDLHRMSAHCKPVSCLVWPTSPESIVGVNEMAADMGFDERCQLSMVEVD